MKLIVTLALGCAAMVFDGCAFVKRRTAAMPPHHECEGLQISPGVVQISCLGNQAQSPTRVKKMALEYLAWWFRKAGTAYFRIADEEYFLRESVRPRSHGDTISTDLNAKSSITRSW